MYEVIYLTFVNVMHFRFMFIPLKILSRLYSSANPYSSKTYIYFHSFECSNELIRQRNILLSLSMYFQMQKSSRHLFVIQTLSLQQYILYKVCVLVLFYSKLEKLLKKIFAPTIMSLPPSRQYSSWDGRRRKLFGDTLYGSSHLLI